MVQLFRKNENRVIAFSMAIFLLQTPVFSVAQDSSFKLTYAVPGEKNSNDTLKDSSVYKKRQWFIGGINVAGYGGSLIILNNAWYKGFPKTSFHTFDDSREWLQTDKIGHAWTAYSTGRLSAAMWRWAGLPQKKAAIIGGASSSLYLTVIEILDAHSAGWGWSWSDIGANIFGSGLFIGQELGWEEQRIQFKFSFHKKNYDEEMLEQRTNELFGNSWYERMLKDYNGQTYWFSVNLRSFIPGSTWPAWLNLAVGYGTEGLFGGFENLAKDNNGNIVFDRRDIPRRRQFYLAPDIDFTKIKTGKKWLKTAFSFLNTFKAPAPGIEFGNKTRLRKIIF